jgi:hypothetical protein
LKLGDDPTTWMLAEEEDPADVGQRFADALEHGRSATVQWVPTDQLEPVTLWVNPAQVSFWQLTQVVPQEPH